MGYPPSTGDDALGTTPGVGPPPCPPPAAPADLPRAATAPYGASVNYA